MMKKQKGGAPAPDAPPLDPPLALRASTATAGKLYNIIVLSNIVLYDTSHMQNTYSSLNISKNISGIRLRTIGSYGKIKPTSSIF